MQRTQLTWAALAVVTLAACSDNGPEGSTVSLSFTSQTTGSAESAAPFAAAAAPDTLLDGANTLIITKAELVLREIELERISDDACDDMAGDDDLCEKFVAGPVLLDLPLDGTVETVFTIAVDTGTYDEIEFELHKVSNDDPEDAEFRAQHPDMIGKSIRVQGTYNGQPFTYESDLNEDQEHALVPPLVIGEGVTSTNVTIIVNLDVWFRDGGGDLVNPQSGNKGSVNENMIRDNIRDSFEGFEDEDRDGDEDDA
jgi:hypothetical protein